MSATISDTLLSDMFAPLHIRGRTVPAVFAIYEPSRCISNLESYINTLPAGVGLIFRGYNINNRTEYITRAAALSKAKNIAFFPANAQGYDNGMAIITALSAASLPYAGMHIASRVSRADTLLLRPALKDRVITRGAHNIAELHEAHASGTDIGFLSPVFPTRTHPEAEPLGVDAFTRTAAVAPLPVLALGGVTNSIAVRKLHACEAIGFASIGYFDVSHNKTRVL